MTFSRKRSIDKRVKGEQNSGSDTLNTTKTSFRPSSSRLLNSNNKNFHDCVTRLQALSDTIEEIPVDRVQKDIYECMQAVLDIQKTMLTSQKLVGCRESSNLFTKYIQYLKKKGITMNQSNSTLLLNAFKNISEDLNTITKEQKNDELVLEANIIPFLINILEAMAYIVQEEAKNNASTSRPSLMKKNSLKKVSEATTVIRPSSRGKLSSLSKKQRMGSKGDILDIKLIKQKKQESQTFISSNEQGLNHLQIIVYNLACSLKNVCANKKVRRQLLKQEYLRLINRYLVVWNQKNSNQFSKVVLVQLTSACRHLVAEEKSLKIFLKSNCFDPWTRLIEIYPTHNDIVFNLLRIISKLSASAECCFKLQEKKQFLKILCSFFKGYKSHIHIVIRVAFIFANMTSYIENIRNEIIEDFDAWPSIFDCFEHYAKSELEGKSQVDKMGISMAAWDLPAMKKQSDIEALMKIIRLIANLFTVPEIGKKIYTTYSANYRELIMKLKILLGKKSDIERFHQLIACVLSCLTNTLYYDRDLLLASQEYKTMKKQLIDLLVDFVVQIDHEEVCCESLRVVSNLTRMKQFIKPVLDAKLHEAIMILLDSTSKEIVYYSLGIIINLLADDEFKAGYGKSLVGSILDILSECQSQDFDVVGVALKAVSIIIENRSQNIEPKQLQEIQNCLVHLGTNCDQVMLGSNQESYADVQSVQQSRNLINVLLNNMPEQKFTCPVKNCGRKFAEEAKLQEHVSRRHKVA